MLLLPLLLTVAAPPQLLLLDLETIGVAKDKAVLLNGTIASEIAKRSDLHALTAADLRAMTDLEAAKASVGCDDSSCLSEIAAALGARYVIYGRVGALDDELFLQLNLFDAVTARAVAREEVRARQLRELSNAIPAAVSSLLSPLGAGVAVVDEDLSLLAITGGVLAVAGGVVAAGTATGAAALEAALWSEGGDVDVKTDALETAPWLWLASIGGLALAATGGVLLAVEASE